MTSGVRRTQRCTPGSFCLPATPFENRRRDAGPTPMPVESFFRHFPARRLADLIRDNVIRAMRHGTKPDQATHPAGSDTP
ncbi:hypothetical protein [Burkholderia cepacia]|uniref:hypothetical protein n=1 Tax=Burkholderia cepacia TaxID=292 RepID=UPI0012D988A0|nr:hypothetical protein [Burkholderia cepacia]